MYYSLVFFFNVPAPTEMYPYEHTLSLHDALPIWIGARFGNECKPGSHPNKLRSRNDRPWPENLRALSQARLVGPTDSIGVGDGCDRSPLAGLHGFGIASFPQLSRTNIGACIQKHDHLDPHRNLRGDSDGAPDQPECGPPGGAFNRHSDKYCTVCRCQWEIGRD